MKQERETLVVHAEALHDGDVLLTFADASCAIYSAREAAMGSDSTRFGFADRGRKS
jgi:hypothetical protein